MIIRLLLAFTLIPLVELYLLLQLAEATSAGVTFLLVIATGIIGSLLARREGAAAWQRFRGALGQSRVPNREIQDGAMIVFAAALLLTPGLLTDALGFTLLIPLGRDLMRRHVFSRFFAGFKMQVTNFAGDTESGGQTIDGQTIGGQPVDSINRKRREDSKTIDATSYQRKPAH